MKAKALTLWLFCLLIASPRVRGDGCFIPPTACAKVQIPDQRALIHFDKGMETLVIDTAFKGDGTQTVGIYDTAVLSSLDGGALLDWLGKNGFDTPTNFIPAIHAYAEEGWFFVASKIRLDASLIDAAKPSPLALTFKTKRPVYPLRLTGIGNEACRIDLYIFGPGRAEFPNFAVERFAQPLYPDMKKENWGRRLDRLRIRHPLLRTLEYVWYDIEGGEQVVPLFRQHK